MIVWRLFAWRSDYPDLAGTHDCLCYSANYILSRVVLTRSHVFGYVHVCSFSAQSSTLHGKEEPETRAMDAGTAPSLQEVTPAKVPTVAGGSVDTLATSAVSATSAPGLGLPVAPVGEKVYLCPICHKPDDGGLMISCDKCNNDEWYHM